MFSSKCQFDAYFIQKNRRKKKLRATTNRSSIESTTEISIPDLRTRAEYARFRVGARWSPRATFDGSARRGARSIKHTCSTAAESPWLEVSTVGLSCRLLIAGTMQQMALIAIPTLPPHLPTLLPFSHLLSLSLSFFRTLYRDLLFLPPLMPFFSHPSSREFPPRWFDPTSRDSICSISSRKLRTSRFYSDFVLIWSVARLKINTS